MTDDRALTEEQALLAAEYALGILDGSELAQARTLAASNAAFRAEMERWSGRLGPMLDETVAVEAPRHLWRNIAAMVGEDRSSNVVELKRRVSLWRGATAAMTALAACLAVVLVVEPRTLRPPPSVPALAAAPPLVAMVSDDRQMKLVASWDPAARRLVLAVAGDMPKDASHAHQLWVIPPGGKPRSLGVMGSGKQTHMSLEQTLAELMRQGATIAISVEPPGGSPTGLPTGAVIASGTLRTA